MQVPDPRFLLAALGETPKAAAKTRETEQHSPELGSRSSLPPGPKLDPIPSPLPTIPCSLPTPSGLPRSHIFVLSGPHASFLTITDRDSLPAERLDNPAGSPPW